ncbi:hypothetical protein NCCP2222_19130 [Sporosarcina sp. NCCP-2222]|uniref:hypothetical protein n=1 Tax=Sporosarcina sp. NCCP-2222 TaxID=2935073 RepID=UPI00207F60C5|nr:hypothetical protein [Sporosarcina sp. NCCP-2222]GKV55966.1 hypothetical protein NCCP2222_19130 [Sporosarcina sp. NCCP-2222]
MANWIEPKLDWTRDDYYNFDDLNRVENNAEVVTGLVGYFIPLPPLVSVKDRNMKRIEFADSLNRIESNQDILRQRYTPIGWLPNKMEWEPNTPFSFSDAIRLEHNLYLLYKHYKGNTETVPICGAFICGEEVI